MGKIQEAEMFGFFIKVLQKYPFLWSCTPPLFPSVKETVKQSLISGFRGFHCISGKSNEKEWKVIFLEDRVSFCQIQENVALDFNS